MCYMTRDISYVIVIVKPKKVPVMSATFTYHLD